MKTAELHLRRFAADETTPLLLDTFLEADGCWMFFRNRDVHLPPEAGLANAAYVVSKRGHFRSVGDMRDEPERLREYLQFLSNYFIEHQM